MNALPEVGQTVDSALLEEYEDIFIKVKEWGAFNKSDMDKNGLCTFDEEVPDFVAEFERELDRKPGLPSDVSCFLDHSADADELM